MLNLSGAQAFIAMPTFLAYFAETQLRTNHSGASRHDVFTCWPEAIQYFLRRYATASALHEVLDDLRNVHQKPDEVEEEYFKRLNKAVFRFGNFRNDYEKVTLYMDGLSDTIRMVVSCYHERVHLLDRIFKILFHYAKSEYEGYHACFMHFVPSIPTKQTNGRSLPSSSSGSSRGIPRTQKNVVMRRQSQVNLVESEEVGDGKNKESIIVVNE